MLLGAGDRAGGLAATRKGQVMFCSPRCFLCNHRLGLLAFWRCLRRPAGVSHLRVTLAGLLDECFGRWICGRCEPRADRTLRLRPR